MFLTPKRVIISLLILNEIRGAIVVGTVLWSVFR